MKITLERAYDLLTGEEDARVCKDIPDAACHHQPRNFFAYFGANMLNKIADEITSAKLVLPWLLGVLGAPLALIGFLVPIREAGALLPQMLVAAAIRHRPQRKGTWLLGALLSAVSLAAMAVAAVSLEGAAAGWSIVALLILFSLARGLCSVAAKDVLGKTVSKSRRGVLMGWSAGLGGLAVLAIGLWLGWHDFAAEGPAIFAALLLLAAALWLFAALLFHAIRELPGATEGGGNALEVALRSFALLATDRQFRHFVVTRILLLGVALAAPFYALLAQQSSGIGLAGIGSMIVANGLAASISAPLWGYWSDRSARQVMTVASLLHALLVALVLLAVWQLPQLVAQIGFWAAAVFLLTLLHSGVRIGRKVYLVDMATAETRATYVALSNTLIGLAMLAAGSIGVLGDLFGAATALALLGLLSLLAALAAVRLPEVSG